MEKKILTEITRMREIMGLPDLLNEQDFFRLFGKGSKAGAAAAAEKEIVAMRNAMKGSLKKVDQAATKTIDDLESHYRGTRTLADDVLRRTENKLISKIDFKLFASNLMDTHAAFKPIGNKITKIIDELEQGTIDMATLQTKKNKILKVVDNDPFTPLEVKNGLKQEIESRLSNVKQPPTSVTPAKPLPPTGGRKGGTQTTTGSNIKIDRLRKEHGQKFKEHEETIDNIAGNFKPEIREQMKRDYERVHDWSEEDLKAEMRQIRYNANAESWKNIDFYWKKLGIQNVNALSPLKWSLLASAVIIGITIIKLTDAGTDWVERKTGVSEPETPGTPTTPPGQTPTTPPSAENWSDYEIKDNPNN